MATVEEAQQALKDIGMLPAQQRLVPALTLLGLLDLTPAKSWSAASNPLRGTSELLNFANVNYATTYAPNTREQFRKTAIHHFIAAGLIVKNPGQMLKTNSQNTGYRVTSEALALLKAWGTPGWAQHVAAFKSVHSSPVDRYAQHRIIDRIALKQRDGLTLRLSPGEHSDLIHAVISEFGSRFTPGGRLIYAGDTGEKWSSYFDEPVLTELGVAIPDAGAKMPDVLILHPAEEGNWLVVVEAYHSGGDITDLRKEQLQTLLAGCAVPVVFVTAYADRTTQGSRAKDVAWETDVWVWQHPDHLIHYNGQHLLQIYRLSDVEPDDANVSTDVGSSGSDLQGGVPTTQ